MDRTLVRSASSPAKLVTTSRGPDFVGVRNMAGLGRQQHAVVSSLGSERRYILLSSDESCLAANYNILIIFIK